MHIKGCIIKYSKLLKVYNYKFYDHKNLKILIYANKIIQTRACKAKCSSFNKVFASSSAANSSSFSFSFFFNFWFSFWHSSFLNTCFSENQCNTSWFITFFWTKFWRSNRKMLFDTVQTSQTLGSKSFNFTTQIPCYEVFIKHCNKRGRNNIG